jgi:tRNA(Ile)-lysidine synthase
LIREHADLPAPGLLRLRPDFLRTKDTDAAIYALRILLAVTGGTPHLPDEARAEALYRRFAVGASVRAVLSRTLADRRKAGIFLLREARGPPSIKEVRDGIVWDGRYRIASPKPPSHHLFATGEKKPDAVPESLLRQAAAAQPMLPPEWTAVPVLAPWTRYLPSFDLAPARAVAELVGAPPIPAPPFQEHD